MAVRKTFNTVEQPVTRWPVDECFATMAAPVCSTEKNMETTAHPVQHEDTCTHVTAAVQIIHCVKGRAGQIFTSSKDNIKAAHIKL